MTSRVIIPARDFDLAATLDSGQAFRWRAESDGWEGVIDDAWCRLRQDHDELRIDTFRPLASPQSIVRYLGLDVDLNSILESFGPDPALQEAARACRGLRLLRQPTWECLASFILSSTKQITQIRQVLGTLCERFGDPVPVPVGSHACHGFPPPARLAAVTETELRACRMGFRAPYLRAASQTVAAGHLPLDALATLPIAEARGRLLELPGVGPKIADCVLLFGCGHPSAFPIDVWVARALRQAYFGGREVPLRELQEFAANRFGRWAGYAQQYLFHYARRHGGFSG